MWRHSQEAGLCLGNSVGRLFALLGLRPSSIRRRLTLWVVGAVTAATAITSGALYLTARQGLLQQADDDADVLASVLSHMGTLSQTFDRTADELISNDQTSSAMLLAEYVALAERARQTPSQTTRILKRLLAMAPDTEVWITDSNGRTFLHPNSDQPFIFSPDPKRQPQASEFWPLLTGEKQVVNQPMQPRELDGKLFKYVGVAGVDKPRIVQVGFNGRWIQSVSDQFSIERLAHTLIEAKALQAMYWVYPDSTSLPMKGAGLEDPAAHFSVRRELLLQAMAQEKGVVTLSPSAIEVYQRIKTPKGEITGVLAASLSRDDFDQLLGQVLEASLGLGVLIAGLGAWLAWRFTHRLTGPIVAVTKTAAEVGRGDFSRLDRLHRARQQTDEVGQLANVLETMAVEVRDREQVLEGLVKERTQQLEAKNLALQEAQAKIDQELDHGQRLQLGSLPDKFPDIPGWQGAAKIIPALQMGGDFYDFIPLPDGRVGLVMADVSGKGVAAAFFMAVARTTLSELAPHVSDPGECLERVNELMCERNPLDMFVTVFYAVLDPRTGSLSYANAGHNPPRQVSAGRVMPLEGSVALALGILPEVAYTTNQHTLQPGDLLLLYTDGVTEAFNASHLAYGEARLDALLAAQGMRPPADVLQALIEDVAAHAAGAPQSDDITVTALKWQP